MRNEEFKELVKSLTDEKEEETETESVMWTLEKFMKHFELQH